MFLENGVDGAGSVIASYGDKQAEIIYSKITDSKLPTQIQGEMCIRDRVISSLVGTIIPMFFHKINIDPAVASGPLITTINDLVAVITYYGLSGLVLIQLFHI